MASRLPNTQTPVQTELQRSVSELLSEVQSLSAIANNSSVNFGELYVKLNKITHEVMPRVIETANQLI
jgi:hypothetical protein